MTENQKARVIATQQSLVKTLEKGSFRIRQTVLGLENRHGNNFSFSIARTRTTARTYTYTRIRRVMFALLFIRHEKFHTLKFR